MIRTSTTTTLEVEATQFFRYTFLDGGELEGVKTLSGRVRWVSSEAWHGMVRDRWDHMPTVYNSITTTISSRREK